MANTDTDLTLRIGGDATGATAATTETKTNIKSVAETVAAVAAAFKSMGATAVTSLSETAAAAKATAASVKELGESISAMREMVSGVGEALLAAFAVEAIIHFAEKMGETGEKTEHTAQMLGESVGEVQKTNAAFTLMGVSVDKGNMALLRLDKAFATAKAGSKQQAEAFKSLGVDINGAYTNTQLLGAAMEGFKNMADGPQKAAAAMVLFGRSGAAMIPFLDLGKAGMEELNRVTSEYGIGGGVAQQATEKAAQLGAAFNENKVATEGFGNVMADAFAPALTVVVQGVNDLIASWIKSYNEGGAVKTIITQLVEAFDDFISVVVGLGALIDAAFKIASGVVKGFQGDWQAVKDAVSGEIEDLKQQFITLGKLIYDALTNNVIQGGQDLIASMQQTGQRAAALGAKLKADLSKPAQDIKTAWKSAADDIAAADKFIANLHHGGPKHQLGTAGEGAEGTTAGDPGKKGHAKKGGGSGGDDELQQWQAQLQDKKLAENDFWNDDLAGDVKFWQDKLAILEAETGGTKAEESKRASEIRWTRQTILNDSKALANQQRQQELADSAASVRDAVAAAHAKYTAVKDGLDAQMQAVKTAQQDGDMSPAKALAALESLNAQKVAAELEKIAAINAADLAGIKAREAIYATDKVNLDKAKHDEITLEIVTQGQITDAVAQGAKDRQAIEDAAAKTRLATYTRNVSGIVDSWATGMRGMIQGTTSFQQVVLNMWNKVLDGIVGMIEKIVTKWVVGVTTQKMASVAGDQAIVASRAQAGAQTASLDFLSTIKAVTNSAVKAASAAYSAMAGIPIVGPELGAIAAGVTFVAVEAFGAMASASGGYDIPSGVNPITQLHQEEMVLPATIANPMRSMLAGYGAGGSAGASGAGGSGGGDNYNFHITTFDGPSMEKMLRGGVGDTIVKGLIAKRRQGQGAGVF